MAVDYREVNLQLESTANQLLYQPYLFQRLGGQHFLRKLTICGVITDSVYLKTAQKVTAIVTPGGISVFGMSIWYLNCSG